MVRAYQQGGIETHLEIITKDYKKQYVDGIEKNQIAENLNMNLKRSKEVTKR